MQTRIRPANTRFFMLACYTDVASCKVPGGRITGLPHHCQVAPCIRVLCSKEQRTSRQLLRLQFPILQQRSRASTSYHRRRRKDRDRAQNFLCLDSDRLTKGPSVGPRLRKPYLAEGFLVVQ